MAARRAFSCSVFQTSAVRQDQSSTRRSAIIESLALFKVDWELLMNVGEHLVSSYLRYIRECEFTQLNLYTVEAQGEIDVIGINLRDRKVYVCEVAIHLLTGLQYTKDKRPNNVKKLTEKFSRDIDYANKYFTDYEKNFMLWSPIVKGRRVGSLNDQMNHLETIGANINASHGVTIDFVVNQRFQACMQEMRQFARLTTADLKCPVMRLFQVEEHLGKHVERLR